MSDDPLSVCCRHLAKSQHIIEEKNAEIERLRLTDEEREALAAAAGFCEGPAGVAPAGLRQLEIHAATIRGLLERTK